MSKRYGRNQKRAAREAIAELHVRECNLSDALLMQQELGNHMRVKIETMQSALDDVARELGQYFYGLPPVKRRIEEHQDRFRMPKPIPASALMFRDTDEISSLVSHAVYELSFLKSSVDRDRITGSVHVELETPSGRRFYALSASAWESMRKDAYRLERQILPMIAREMAEFIVRGQS